MLVPNRNYQSPEYRYGFQGQEKDDEIKGSGNSINYKFRMHDPRVGRFFAVDPLAGKYPWNSPYAFSENIVINAVELEGLEKLEITGSNGSKITVTADPNIDLTYKLDLKKYHLNVDLGHHDINLFQNKSEGNTESRVPDVLGIDLNLSGEVAVAKGELGLNILWHPSVSEGTLAPEIFGYAGKGVDISVENLIGMDVSLSGTASIIWGYAKDENGNRSSDRFISDGRNWEGLFYNKSLTFGEGYVVTGGVFSGLEYGKKATSDYWSGYSLGFGVGASASGGTSKLAKGIKSSFKISSFYDVINKLSFMPVNVQDYLMFYGNGGEGDRSGWFNFDEGNYSPVTTPSINPTQKSFTPVPNRKRCF